MWDRRHDSFAFCYHLYDDENYFNIIYTDNKGENKKLIINASIIIYNQEKYHKMIYLIYCQSLVLISMVSIIKMSSVIIIKNWILN